MTGASRRAILAAAGASLVTGVQAASAATTPPLVLTGRPQQGGFLIGRTLPRAAIILDGATIGPASARGLFFIGFDRDAPPKVSLAVEARRRRQERIVQVEPGDFDIQRIDGLPESQVAPQDPDLLTRIAAEALRKAAGFSSHDDADHFAGGFHMPFEPTRVSGRFGGQRILNGQPSRPHYGADLAAPVGTPVRSPARGLVAFAETGLHYEGGLVFLDHGQGLISAYLHLSRVDVAAGQVVEQDQLIGAVGQEGRATGPHLCWRLKWRGRNLDPTLLVDIPTLPPI